MNVKFYNYNIMENFYRLNKESCLILYNKFNEPYQVKITFDQYLNQAEKTKQELFRVATLEGKKTFMCAPTGSGKTYTIITEIFQEIMKQKLQDTIYINLLLVPNRSQSEQIQEEYEPYNIKSIVGVGKNEQSRKISLTKSQDYSFVFDKIDDLIDVLHYFKNHNIKFKVCMIVDEAHTLTTARFRNRAVEKIFEVEKFVLSNKGSVIYITASAEAMGCYEFDEYIFFEKNNKKPTFKEINVYVNSKNRTFNDFVLDVITPHEHGLIRDNDKDSQNWFCDKLQENGYNALKVNGDEKEFIKDENGHIVYVNEILDVLINKSSLPEKAFCFATSMLDAGQNITGIGKNKIKDPTFCTYYCVRNPRDLDFVSTEQVANRIRFINDSFNIIYGNSDIYNKNKTDQIKDFKSFFVLLKQLFYLLNLEITRIKNIIDISKEYYETVGYVDYEYAMEDEINALLSRKDPKVDRDNSFGDTLEFKNGELIVHMNFFYNYVLEVFYKQFYYHKDLFEEKLKTIFNCNINFIENIEVTKLKNSTRLNEIKADLLKFKDNKDFLNNYDDPRYEGLSKSKVFKDCLYFVRIGIKLNDAIELCCTKPNIELNKLRNEYTMKYIQNNFTSDDYDLLQSILLGKTRFISLKQSNQKDRIGTVLLNEKYKKGLQSMIKVGIPLKIAIKVPTKEVNNYINQELAIKNNLDYLVNAYDIKTTAAMTQFLILEYARIQLNFDIYGKNQIVLTETILNDIIALIKKKQKITYKRSDLIKLLKMIFNTWKRKYRKIDTISILTLKIKR